MGKRVYKFIAIGKAPVESKYIEFIKYLDLGVQDIYIDFSDALYITYKSNERIEVNHTIEGIKRAYENIGCVNISVVYCSVSQ